MTPLFGCIPVCMSFVAIGIVGVVVVVFGLSNPTPTDGPPPDYDAPSRYGRTGPPPWWVFVLMMAVLWASVLVVALIWPE